MNWSQVFACTSAIALGTNRGLGVLPPLLSLVAVTAWRTASCLSDCIAPFASTTARGVPGGVTVRLHSLELKIVDMVDHFEARVEMRDF